MENKESLSAAEPKSYIKSYMSANSMITAKELKSAAPNENAETPENKLDISRCDTIFFGYPVWRYSCPMAIYSFLTVMILAANRYVYFVPTEQGICQQCKGYYCGNS